MAEGAGLLSTMLSSPENAERTNLSSKTLCSTFRVLNRWMFESLPQFVSSKKLPMRTTLADQLEYQFMRLGVALLAPFGASEARQALHLKLSAQEKQGLEPVRALREQLQHDHTEIPVLDFGSWRRKTTMDVAPFAKPPTRIISEIFGTASARHPWGVLLYQLTKAKQPQTILELGTNLGVSGAYIVQAMQQNPHPNKRLITLEGNPHLSERAARHLAEMKTDVQIDVVTGIFQDTLPDVLSQFGPFELVFLDGHHEREATLRYFDLIAPHLRSGAWVVFDDLEPWSPTVRGAFREIKRRYPQAPTTDLVKFGILIWP